MTCVTASSLGLSYRIKPVADSTSWRQKEKRKSKAIVYQNKFNFIAFRFWSDEFHIFLAAVFLLIILMGNKEYASQFTRIHSRVFSATTNTTASEKCEIIPTGLIDVILILISLSFSRRFFLLLRATTYKRARKYKRTINGEHTNHKLNFQWSLRDFLAGIICN